MVKLNKVDGEFMVVGRQTVETSVVLTQFGQGPANQVQIEGGGIQELEFADGFRLSVRTNQPMTIATDVVNGVSANQLTGGVQPISRSRRPALVLYLTFSLTLEQQLTAALHRQLPLPRSDQPGWTQC